LACELNETGIIKVAW